MKRAYPNLRAFMDATGATQAKVALDTGTSQATISRVLNGKKHPSLALALAIAAYANIPVESLAPTRNGRAA
jgi:transcriptional regulator with XRE-family HTH domain